MKIINAKTILTPDGWKQDLEVAVGADGRIARIGPSAGDADTNVDLLLPAPVNLHCHTFQRAMAGLTEMRGPSASDSFWTWRRLMYRFLDLLDPDQIEAIAALAFVEMLEAGFAGVAEFHYLHHAAGGGQYDRLAELSDRIVAAADTAGIGLTLLPVFYEYGGCDRRPLTGGQLRFQNGLDRYWKLHGEAARTIGSAHTDYAIGVAPHSLRAADPANLAELEKARANGPIHMHIAEQVAEVEEVQRHYGARPVEWLMANVAVDDRWCLIHCTQMTEAETTALAASGAVAGLCPITESSLGDGIFNGTTYFQAGGRAGVGSDSNIHISLFDELKTLEYSQRLRDRSRAALATASHSTGRVLFDAASRAGAQAAARNSGSLEQGRIADMIGISCDNHHLGHLAGDRLLDGLIFGGFGGRCITDVWSAGRHMVRQGQHVEASKVRQRYRDVLAQIGADL